MSGRAVLVTRPEPGASETTARLRAAGFAVINAPMLMVERRSAAFPAPDQLQAVLVTSANAVGGLPPALFGVRLFAVGAATAARARLRGFKDVESADGDAATLLQRVLARCDQLRGPLLLAHGEGRGDALAAALMSAGFTVIALPVYAAVPAAALPPDADMAWRSHDLDAALFFSGATAAAFARVVATAGTTSAARAVTAIAISSKVAEALALLPWRHVRVAVTPDQEAMLSLLR